MTKLGFPGFPANSNRSLQANKPDIFLLKYQKKVEYFIKFSAPADTRTTRKEENKRANY